VDLGWIIRFCNNESFQVSEVLGSGFRAFRFRIWDLGFHGSYSSSSSKNYRIAHHELRLFDYEDEDDDEDDSSFIFIKSQILNGTRICHLFSDT
jgi:hypothetical protein